MPIDFNQPVIEEFRANRGRVGGMFEGARLLLLTTTGARTGTRHTVPVGYLPDQERVLVIASAAGAPHHPSWFHNLLANPTVTVEDGAFTYDAKAIVLDGTERDQAFARAAEADPGWAAYQARTTRVIPVVALEQLPGPPVVDAPSTGAAIRVIHDAFRRELALIRKEITESGPGVGAQLRINCLTLCQGLHHHHTAEDGHLFPAAEENDPSLAGPLARLREEHQTITQLLDELRALLAGTEPVAPGLLASEVERLTDELEAHLDYEEEHLVPALDALN